MYGSVLEDVLAVYGIKSRKIFEHQKGYRNEIWPILTPDQRMINVTFYKREMGMVERIARADAVSEYLAAKNMPTRRRADPRILQLKSDVGLTNVGVYSYLPGQTIPWEAYTMTHIKLLGKAMSDMHAQLTDMPIEGFPLVCDEYSGIVDHMEHYFAAPLVIDAIKRKLQIELDESWLATCRLAIHACRDLPNQQVLHMDFVRGNVLFDEAGPNYNEQLDDIALSGILDFEKTAVGNPIFDSTRTLAFLLVDCKYKSEEKIYKYFLHSGYKKRGMNHDIGDDVLRERLIGLFLLYDFYKFLRHNPYESLYMNEHFTRTKDMLKKRNMIRYV